MPQSKKTPLSWYIIDILVGIAAALYMQYLRGGDARADLPTWAAVGLIGGILLVIGSGVTKVRGMLPLGLGALAFGGLALFFVQ